MENEPKFLVSSCLIGKKCRYDAKDMGRSQLIELYKQGKVIDVCPEELGGLPTPRPPAERVGNGVLTKENNLVTEEFIAGAERALRLIANQPIARAYLKSKSPMCGCGQIYDGSFSGKLKSGDGVFTEKLKTLHNIPIEAVD